MIEGSTEEPQMETSHRKKHSESVRQVVFTGFYNNYQNFFQYRAHIFKTQMVMKLLWKPLNAFQYSICGLAIYKLN